MAFRQKDNNACNDATGTENGVSVGGKYNGQSKIRRVHILHSKHNGKESKSKKGKGDVQMKIKKIQINTLYFIIYNVYRFIFYDYKKFTQVRGKTSY